MSDAIEALRKMLNEPMFGTQVERVQAALAEFDKLRNEREHLKLSLISERKWHQEALEREKEATEHTSRLVHARAADVARNKELGKEALEIVRENAKLREELEQFGIVRRQLIDALAENATLKNDFAKLKAEVALAYEAVLAKSGSVIVEPIDKLVENLLARIEALEKEFRPERIHYGPGGTTLHEKPGRADFARALGSGGIKSTYEVVPHEMICRTCAGTGRRSTSYGSFQVCGTCNGKGTK